MNSYISGCVLIDDVEAKKSKKKYLLEAPVEGDLISKKGKYQYVLNKEGKVEFDPETNSDNDLKIEQDKEKVRYIRGKYNANDEIKLLNQAVAALLNKEEVPNAYKEYRAYVDAF